MPPEKERPMHDAAHNPPPAEGWRAISFPAEYRDDGDRPPRLVGHFARFNTFNEIDSAIEGRFLERIMPGAFKKTFAESGERIKLLFQHGRDPQVGDKPIGAITVLREDAHGPYFEADILDGVPDLIRDGLKRGVYGVSYRFQVNPKRDEWNDSPTKSPDNPDRLPERTIREFQKVWELGPVTFPADHGADIQVRSITDAMRPPTTTPPVAPSDDAGQPPTSPERRPEPAPTAAPITKETRTIMEYITREEKASRATELKAALARQATEYPGVLPAEAQATWDSDSAELETIERDIAAWDSRQARLAAYAQDERKVERSYEPVASFARKTESDIYDLSAIWNRSRSPEDRDQTLRDNAMRATDQANFAHPDADVDKTRSSISFLLDNADSPDKELARRILTTGNPTYRRTFYKYLTGQPMTAEEQRAGALTVQTDATGGFSVPFYFDPTLVAVGAHTTINPYRRACRVIPIVGTDTFHGVTAAAAVVARAAENAASSEGGPAIGQITAIVGKVHGMITLSVELLQDNPGIAAEMVALIAEAKDTEEEAIFTNGVGDALGAGYNPIGMLPVHGTAGAYTHMDTIAAAGAIAKEDAFAVEAALPVRHRMNAQWFMNRSIIRVFQALETSNGVLFGGTNYPSVGFVNNEPAGNTGLRLLGYPVNEVPSGNVWADTNDLVVAALADPKSFYIIERVGMTVEVIPHLWAAAQMPTGQRGIYAWWRNTAKPANVDAGRRLALLA
jgi:HK97 family phage major capsid protein/HK97 family phage prohead protease